MAMAAKRQQPTTLTLRLRTEPCAQCEPLTQPCDNIIRCQNPRCRYTCTRAGLYEWEVYDDCCLCPLCEVPMPGYDCYVLCRLESKAQLELFG